MIYIMVVSADRDQRRRICAALREPGYNAIEAESSAEALELTAHESVNVIVADYECGGCDLTAELRGSEISTPVIIMIPGRLGAERRRVFRSGADGYMYSPVDTEELLMRIENLLWRCNIVDDALLRVGSCELRANTLQVITPTQAIDLRRMEFLLLQKLLSYPGRIFTRPQLMDEIWGYDSESEPRTVDTHIKRLRQKLRNVEDIRIQTVRGLGYRAAVPKRARMFKSYNQEF